MTVTRSDASARDAMRRNCPGQGSRQIGKRADDHLSSEVNVLGTATLEKDAGSELCVNMSTMTLQLCILLVRCMLAVFDTLVI